MVGDYRKGRKRGGENDDDEMALKEMLYKYGLTCISTSTVWRWMKLLGFNHEPCQKGYYVDGQKKQGRLSTDGPTSNGTCPMRNECTSGFKFHWQRQEN